MRDLQIIFIVAVCLLALAASARADSVHISEPVADRWMYLHNSTPGTRTSASTFSYLPFTGEDDRFSQVLLKFDTAAAGIPAGLGPRNYQIDRLVLTAIYVSPDPVIYDPTEDPRGSYGPGASADPDKGRPLELYGTGFRGGFAGETFQENSPFDNRNAFALGAEKDGVLRDVTNNVTMGFDSVPWAVAKIEAPSDEEPGTYVALQPGEFIPNYSRVTFAVNLAVPGVANYIKQGLDRGCFWFTISSLHPIAGQQGSGFPGFFMKEDPEQALFHDVASSLDIDYSLPLRISRFVRNATDHSIHIEWNASPGFRYEVQTSESMAVADWHKLERYEPAVAGTLSWDGANVLPRSFYRITRTLLP